MSLISDVESPDCVVMNDKLPHLPIACISRLNAFNHGIHVVSTISIINSFYRVEGPTSLRCESRRQNSMIPGICLANVVSPVIRLCNENSRFACVVTPGLAAKDIDKELRGVVNVDGKVF